MQLFTLPAFVAFRSCAIRTAPAGLLGSSILATGRNKCDLEVNNDLDLMIWYEVGVWSLPGNRSTYLLNVAALEALHIEY
jgi:hypothetical protein